MIVNDVPAVCAVGVPVLPLVEARFESENVCPGNVTTNLLTAPAACERFASTVPPAQPKQVTVPPLTMFAAEGILPPSLQRTRTPEIVITSICVFPPMVMVMVIRDAVLLLTVIAEMSPPGAAVAVTGEVASNFQPLGAITVKERFVPMEKSVANPSVIKMLPIEVNAGLTAFSALSAVTEVPPVGLVTVAIPKVLEMEQMIKSVAKIIFAEFRTKAEIFRSLIAKLCFIIRVGLI